MKYFKSSFYIIILLASFGCRGSTSSQNDTIPVMITFVDENASQREVYMGLDMTPQPAGGRIFKELPLTVLRSWNTKHHLPSTYSLRVQLLENGTVCYLDFNNKVVGCYNENDEEPSYYIGMGDGNGPGEVNRLEYFGTSTGSGSYLYDLNNGLLKYLDIDGNETGKIVLGMRPPYSGYVNGPHEIVTINSRHVGESPVMVHDMKTQSSREVPIQQFPDIRDEVPPYRIVAATLGDIVRVDQDHAIHGLRYLGIFSLIHLRDGVVWTRPYIDADPTENVRLFQREERLRLSDLGRYMYDIDRDKQRYFSYSAHVAGRFLVIYSSEGGSAAFDFYDKYTGDYEFSTRFEGRRSGTRSLDIASGLLAQLTHEDELIIFGFDMPE